ncbi:MAG: hypothetical protein JST42_06165, partial [Bacteroidetes bacterium]|nr:hypothetical protein [Bacteroidota bacterium]
MKYGKTIVVGCLLLAVGIVAFGQPLQLFGFGSSLGVTSGPEFGKNGAWGLSYDSFQNELAAHTRDYTFQIRFRLRNSSDSLLPLNIDYGTIDYADAWLLYPGHRPLHVAGGYLRSSIAGSNVIQRQYYTLPLSLLPRQEGQVVIALRQKTRGYYFDGVSIFSSGALAAVFAGNYERDHSFMLFQWLF